MPIETSEVTNLWLPVIINYYKKCSTCVAYLENIGTLNLLFKWAQMIKTYDLPNKISLKHWRIVVTHNNKTS